MKQIFKIDQALKVVTVDSKTKKKIELIYAIVDMDIADRWINLININNERKNTLRYNYRKFLTTEEVQEKFELFRKNILYINDHYDRVLTDTISIEYLKDNQYILNDLHEQFEVYGNHLEEHFKKNINLSKINSCIKKINKFYDIKLKTLDKVDRIEIGNLYNQYLNYLTRVQEKIDTNWWGEAYLKIKATDFLATVWPGISFNEDFHKSFIKLGKLIEPDHDMVLHEAFLLLNEQIHNFEAIFRNWGKDSALCTCLYDFMPNKPLAEIMPEDYLHEELKPEDYLLFSPEHKWGWAYLGYNTLGKHWSSICHDNDIEVVKRNAVRPQHRFAAETYLNFSTVDDNYDTRINLYKWWLKNKFSEIVDPRMRLEDLALGFIPIAKLYQFTIDSVTTVVTNTLNKHEWNKTIWSSTNSIEYVEIIKV